MRLSLLITRRFLVFNLGQTAFVAFGLAVGVAVQMFVGLLIDSLQEGLIRDTVGSSAHITVRDKDDGEYMRGYKEIKEKIASDSRTTIVNAILTRPGIVFSNGETENILVVGVDDLQNNIYKINEGLIEGRMPQRGNEAVIGKDLLLKIEKKVGDKVRLSNGDGKTGELVIVGSFDKEVSSINESWVVVWLDSAMEIFGLNGKVGSVQAQVSDVFEAEVIATELKGSISDENEIKSWQEENRQLLSALSSQSSSSFMIQFFVMVSVLIAISSVLTITVVQKEKQLGILKAMGMQNRDASVIFLGMGLAIGLIGASIGTGMGFGLFYFFINAVRDDTGRSVFEAYIRWQYVGFTWLAAVGASSFAGYMAARKALKLDPIEIIQNG